jgi:hypothetical protein
MRAVDPQPPDAIVIADDNLVDAALLGITASGARIGRDVDVIAHCNFPADAPAAAPVHRLGYDCRRVLDLALDRLADLAAGRPIPKATVVQALFEDELGVSAHHNTRAPASRREDRSVEMSSRAQRGGRTDAGAPVPLDSGSGNGQ